MITEPLLLHIFDKVQAMPDEIMVKLQRELDEHRERNPKLAEADTKRTVNVVDNAVETGFGFRTTDSAFDFFGGFPTRWTPEDSMHHYIPGTYDLFDSQNPGNGNLVAVNINSPSLAKLHPTVLADEWADDYSPHQVNQNAAQPTLLPWSPHPDAFENAFPSERRSHMPPTYDTVCEPWCQCGKRVHGYYGQSHGESSTLELSNWNYSTSLPPTSLPTLNTIPSGNANSSSICSSTLAFCTPASISHRLCLLLVSAADTLYKSLDQLENSGFAIGFDILPHDIPLAHGEDQNRFTGNT